MRTRNNSTLVFPFYVCDVTQPSMSVRRLAEQGFNTTLNKKRPAITHTKGFKATLEQREGLYFLQATVVALPSNMRLDIRQTTEGVIAKVMLVTLTPTGMEALRNKNDLWTLQRTSVPSEGTQNTTQGIVHTRQQMPGSNRQIGKLQKNDSQEKRRQQRRLWRKVPRPKTRSNRRKSFKHNIGPERHGSRWREEHLFLATSHQHQHYQQQWDNQHSYSSNAPPALAYRHTTKKPLTDTRPMRSTGIPHPRDTPATSDYWIGEGNMWKRVHVQPRWDLYISQQTDDGPDVTKLTPARTMFVRPTDGSRYYRIDGDWTTKRQATLNVEWIGSTNFEENSTYKDEFILDDPERSSRSKESNGHPSTTAADRTGKTRARVDTPTIQKLVSSMLPKQGTTEQSSKADNKAASNPSWRHLLQVAWLGEKQTTPILTANRRGDRHMHGGMDRRPNKQHGIPVNMSPAVSDGMWQNTRHPKQHRHTVRSGSLPDRILKMTAATFGGNLAARQAPAYTSQAQGSVERFHRTLMGQVRALKLKLENNYRIHLTSKHPITPWMVKQAAYLLNRYAVHSDGNISYYRRWSKEHKTPICEFGETVLYMPPTTKHDPKMESRFFPAFWLGKDTATSENMLGISGKVVKARTIRRQIKPAKYDNRMMDIINNSSMAATPTAAFVPLPTPKTQTADPQAAQQTRTHTPQQQPAIADLPTATAPSTQPDRASRHQRKARSRTRSRKAVHQNSSEQQNNKQHRSGLRGQQNHPQQGWEFQQWRWRRRKEKQ